MTGKNTILVIDDDIVLTRIIKQYLEDHGFFVISYPNAQEAISRMGTSIPDIILLDLEMPIIGGHEATLLFRINPNTKNIPIIMVTGRSRDIDKSKSMMMGANDYITKPFKLEILLQKINQYLKNNKNVTQ